MPGTPEPENSTTSILDAADDTIAVAVTVLSTTLALLASLDNLVTLLLLSTSSSC